MFLRSISPSPPVVQSYLPWFQQYCYAGNTIHLQGSPVSAAATLSDSVPVGRCCLPNLITAPLRDPHSTRKVSLVPPNTISPATRGIRNHDDPLPSLALSDRFSGHTCRVARSAPGRPPQDRNRRTFSRCTNKQGIWRSWLIHSIIFCRGLFIVSSPVVAFFSLQLLTMVIIAAS